MQIPRILVFLALALLLFSLSPIHSMAQQRAEVRGEIYDTIAHKAVAGATITLMKRKDSSLVSFTMTDNAGRFSLTGMPNGDYRLLVTHINYHNRSRFFSITDQDRQVNLGRMLLNDTSQLLEEVTVQAEAPPVTLLGDTVQYNAGSFKTIPNANVEDLLKKLPGVRVEKDGTVKAQGEKVKKVLVDGKEFFGTDPKIATRNLPADAVDKVQVYDRASDQAQLTGFDDGNSEKTINLKLKKDKKKGMFGKASAGYGSNERFESRLSLNSFKGARQMSILGMGNNNNAEGFSFMDMLNFSGELNRMKMNGGGGGGISIDIRDDDPNAALLGGGNGGIKTTWAGGLNYNNIIGKKTDFQSNYFYNRYNPKTRSELFRQYILPDSTYYYRQQAFNGQVNNNHRVNLIADIVIDSFRSLKIAPSFGYQDTRSSAYSSYHTESEEGNLGSEGLTDNRGHNYGYNFRNDLLFRNRFRKKGRTFSLSLQTSLNSTDGEGSLLSLNHFYDVLGNNIRTDSINQQYSSAGDLKGYSARAVYTEPLFRHSLVEFSVANSYTKSTAGKITHDYNLQTGKYDELNPLLTNDYENTYGYNQAGLRIRTQRQKSSLAAGLSWQQALLSGKIIAGNKDSVIEKDFKNWLPYFRFQYRFTRYRTFLLTYSASTNQPAMQQLQPVPDISDPLNIRYGNPDLKQEYSHSVRLQFTSLNPFRNKNLFVFLNATKTDNKIVNDDVIDSYGIKTTRPVNVNGIYHAMADINIGLPVRFLKGSVNMGGNVQYSRNRNFINGEANSIHYLAMGPELRLNMNLGETISMDLSGRYNYNQTRYSLSPTSNNRYFSQEYEVDFNWQLPAHFYLTTDFTYTINSQRTQGFNARVPLWNAGISKQFLKYNRGELKFRVYDLLNQNVGISRNSNQNYVEDYRVQSLQRFFMLTFTYSLSKTGLNNGGTGVFKVIKG